MGTVNSHILIVDDNEEILEMVGLMLAINGFKVSSKSRIGNFIPEIENIEPDLILLDKNLGWGDGCQFCAVLKTNAVLKHIPVIMFSAYYKMKETCEVAGTNAFLQKPFEMKELLHIINTLTTPHQQNY